MGDMSLNPEVIEVIDNYMDNEKRPKFGGLERISTPVLKHMAEEVLRDKCVSHIVRLKGSGEDRWTEWDCKYDNYFDGSSFLGYIPWGYGNRKCGYRYFLFGKCLSFFEKHSEDIVNAYIGERCVTIEAAVWNTSSFLELCSDYAKWFDERRERFLHDMSEAIAEVKKFQMSEKPQSHGGVANLLKTLTKTMEKQGADIANIAKVQYAVCIQAGIYIPNEFIQDVAVAMDILEENGDKMA